jgi:CPA1 family monovalent cation:H+ antiporter
LLSDQRIPYAGAVQEAGGAAAVLSIYELAAVLISLSALFGWINRRYFKLPHTIGLLLMGLGSSVFVLGLQAIFTDLDITTSLQAEIATIDFYDTIMNGMLAYLLFAGALHVDFNKMRDQGLAIGLMATVGVMISTLIIGGGIWGAAQLVDLPLPFIWALVLGALISPTDPVAVLSLLRNTPVPDQLKAKIAGEALFNDGMAVVAFTALLAAANAADGDIGHHLGVLHILEKLAIEAGGAILFGILMGWGAYRAMRAIDDHDVEILISIAACTLTYAVCVRTGLSGPLAVVIAGLMISNHDADAAMSQKVQTYMFAFWEVVDEVLNSLLFLLIGLEVLVLTFQLDYVWIILLAIPTVLLARFISVATPIRLLSMFQTFSKGSIPVMTWGGLRGGVSVALALALPDGPYKGTLLAVTYAVVIFSIVVQGLSVGYVVKRSVPAPLNENRDEVTAATAGS